MNSALRRCCCMVVLLLALPLWAQRRTDPLSSTEVDQLREATLEPDKRLKLYVDFARARLASLEQARSDPKTTDRGEITHDWLVDFSIIYDELNDNIDNYADRKEDLRKALGKVIEADTEFQSKLLAIRNAAGIGPKESKIYEFVLTNALETVDASIADHRQLLKEQEVAAKKNKKKNP